MANKILFSFLLFFILPNCKGMSAASTKADIIKREVVLGFELVLREFVKKINGKADKLNNEQQSKTEDLSEKEN